jgi:hypothetical protein
MSRGKASVRCALKKARISYVIVEKEGSMFFSEEKNQKTFTSPPLPRSRPWPDTAAAPEIKVFCFFSSEKKNLL